MQGLWLKPACKISQVASTLDCKGHPSLIDSFRVSMDCSDSGVLGNLFLQYCPKHSFAAVGGSTTKLSPSRAGLMAVGRINRKVKGFGVNSEPFKESHSL